MQRRVFLLAPLAAAMLLIAATDRQPAAACCCAAPPDKAVINADQTIVILWDEKNHVEHFIRKATFQSEADDFGFIVPSPTQPALTESGAATFPLLMGLTAAEIVRQPRYVHSDYDCNFEMSAARYTGAAYPDAMPATAIPPPAVRVLEEKQVAGFNATVLEADTTAVLVEWLQKNGYAFSPAVEAWAAPYVGGHWKFTALKIAKNPAEPHAHGVAAKALHMTFATDQPLFPYREPDAGDSPEKLHIYGRLLRIYFLAEARYNGTITQEQPWTGQTVWSNPLPADKREAVLRQLSLPADTGAATLWLTEFEDPWPYRQAAADLYFNKAPSQATLKRPPSIEYYDVEEWPNWLPLAGIFLLVIAITAGVYARTRKTART